MDYKEKYEQALARAKDIHDAGFSMYKATMENIFPELKESEDERIRKEIINYIKSAIGDEDIVSPWIAWLEKQGEQKPVDIDKEIEDYINSNFFEGSDGGMISDNHRNIGGVTYSDLANLARHFSSSNKQNRWNEDDESMRTRCINALYKCYMGELPQTVVEEIEWLKSLKDRYTWKPSDEQIKGIECAIKTLQHQLNVGDKRLNSLYDDLKKVKRE